MKKNTSHIPVVILAAGESKRFGQAKQLADWFGEPMLKAVIRCVESCGILPFIAVGAHRHLIMTNPDFELFLPRMFEVHRWEEGLSSSIRDAVDYVSRHTPPGVIFLLGDQPLIEASYIQQLIEEAQANPDKLIATAYSKGSSGVGVPAYFPKAYFEALKRLKRDQGAKKILETGHPRLLQPRFIHADVDLLIDVDEPDDLALARHMEKKRSA